MQYVYILIALLISYLFGAVPYGFVIPKLFKGIDIREHGSKNVGATNVTRVLGKKYGIPVFFLDCLKGALPIIIVRYVLAATPISDTLSHINSFDISILYGVAAGIGHIFSIFIGGKGGKAVATGVGAVLALNPIVGLLGIAIFFLVAFTTKYVSIGSVVATFLVGVGMWVTAIIEDNLLTQIVNLIGVSIMVSLIIFMHRKNFVRLYHGTENKIGQKKNQNIEK
jgi:glycerol-3-phosphate acyltransferase PlsY